MDELEKKITCLELEHRECVTRIEYLAEEVQSLKTVADNLNKFAIILERNTCELEKMSDNMNRMQNNIDEIQKTPSKRWDLVVAAIIAGVVGFVIKSIWG